VGGKKHPFLAFLTPFPTFSWEYVPLNLFHHT
jgi:hypothetical protein